MKIEHPQYKVTLMIRVKIGGKWRRIPVIYGRTGRVVPGRVIWLKKELAFENVSYELRYYKEGKACYVAAGKNASDAEEQRRTLQAQLSAKAVAAAAGVAVVEPSGRKLLKAWAQEYANKRSAVVGKSQLEKIYYSTDRFNEGCKKKYLDELTEDDILAFLRQLSTFPAYRTFRKAPSERKYAVYARLRAPVQHKTISKRTIFNTYMIVRLWLLKGGVDRGIFPSPPKAEKKEVTIYSPEEIERFYSLTSGNLRMAVNLMLKCGMRRQEAAHAYFSDIDWTDKTIRIRAKPEFGFETKTRTQRIVPVPDDLLDELREWENRHPQQVLIIQTPQGRPDLRMIRHLKRFVHMNGLKCGHCTHCRMGNPNCEAWELHKFRRTYITAICRHVDLRTAQEYAGHTRIATTERYLKAATAVEGQKRVSQIDFTKPFYE